MAAASASSPSPSLPEMLSDAVRLAYDDRKVACLNRSIVAVFTTEDGRCLASYSHKLEVERVHRFVLHQNLLLIVLDQAIIIKKYDDSTERRFKSEGIAFAKIKYFIADNGILAIATPRRIELWDLNDYTYLAGKNFATPIRILSVLQKSLVVNFPCRALIKPFPMKEKLRDFPVWIEITERLRFFQAKTWIAFQNLSGLTKIWPKISEKVSIQTIKFPTQTNALIEVENWFVGSTKHTLFFWRSEVNEGIPIRLKLDKEVFNIFPSNSTLFVVHKKYVGCIDPKNQREQYLFPVENGAAITNIYSVGPDYLVRAETVWTHKIKPSKSLCCALM